MQEDATTDPENDTANFDPEDWQLAFEPYEDQPEAALSPKRQLKFLSLLHDYCKRGSQFVIATHSPIIMAYPDAWIGAIQTGKLPAKCSIRMATNRSKLP